MDVRPATTAEHGRIAEVLAAAFATDPPLSWFIPDAGRLEVLLRRHFAGSIPLYAASGAIWVAADLSGAALWVAPGAYPFRARGELRVLPARLAVFGRWPRRGIGGLRAVERHHPHEPPHWYLDYIGVGPAGQARAAARSRSSVVSPTTRATSSTRNASGAAASQSPWARHRSSSIRAMRLTRPSFGARGG